MGAWIHKDEWYLPGHNKSIHKLQTPTATPPDIVLPDLTADEMILLLDLVYNDTLEEWANQNVFKEVRDLYNKLRDGWRWR